MVLGYINSPPGTPWTRLATLINLLSRFDTRQVEISNKQLEGITVMSLSMMMTDIYFHSFFFSCENN